MPDSSSPRHRRSIRLKDHDYTSEGGYFITLVTHARQSLFGDIVHDEPRLNDIGRIVYEEWFHTAHMRPYVELFDDEFVVMPNHVHGIIWLFGRGTARRAPTLDHPSTSDYPEPDLAPTVEQFGKPISGSIPTIVRAYKSAVTKRVNELRGTPSVPVWQRNYYEHIISTDRDYEAIAEYIDANPRNWLADSENSNCSEIVR